ncbi:MAG: hypothetical protein A2Z18_01900 [Armatimonadetes bacterium RBG_16_58_9]|nr:MAG: hypothetical protein A2Z18_01900 [Armatimonadetes bacterium RBG_16_58_9]
MQRNRIILATMTTMFVIGIALVGPWAYTASKTSPAETAIRAAAKQNRYAIVTFYKKSDAASTKMLAEVKKLQAKYSSRANFVKVDVDNKVHQNVLSQYGADRSPIPLTLVIAPNGAITAGYPNEIKKTDLSDAFVSTGMAEVLKVLQSGKLAAVCVQNSKTKHNKESLDAAEGLKSDQRFTGAVEIVRIDPSDKGESKFIQQCKADANSDDAQLVVIAPPGRIVGRFDGATSKDAVVASLMKSLGGGGGGGSCGPGGCE